MSENNDEEVTRVPQSDPQKASGSDPITVIGESVRARGGIDVSDLEKRQMLMRIVSKLGGDLTPEQVYDDAFQRGMQQRLDKALAAKDDAKIQELLEMLYSYTSK